MVAISARCGRLASLSGSAVSSAAAISGSAAFLAPLIGISPCSRRPPRMRILSMRCACYRGCLGNRERMLDPAGTTADLTTTIGIEYGFPATSAFDADSAVRRHAIPAVSTVTAPPPQAALDPAIPCHRRRCHRRPRATTPAELPIAPAPEPCASAGFPAAPPRDAAGAAPPPVVLLPTGSACDHARRTCQVDCPARQSRKLAPWLSFVIAFGSAKKGKGPAPWRVRANGRLG